MSLVTSQYKYKVADALLPFYTQVLTHSPDHPKDNYKSHFEILSNITIIDYFQSFSRYELFQLKRSSGKINKTNAMPSTTTILAAAAALFATTNAHMMMKTPTPFGKSTLNNSPLAATGTDFPCKQRQGVYDAEGASNTMPIGVNQTLSFTGSAVHGGGSCQISLTTDKAPTASTQWQVIHSIIGGCPANVDGNLPDNANGDGASKFEFSVPEGISPGDYVLAWTWFNHEGNQEMYMNCAPVTVTSGSGKRDVPTINEPKVAPGFSKRAPSFPAMMVANIGNGCGNQPGFDMSFPDPGDSVQYAGTDVIKPFTGNCMAAVAGATPAPTAGSASLSPSTMTAAPATSATGGIFEQSSAPAAASTPAAVAPVPASPVATAAPSSAPSSSANSSSGSAPTLPGSTTCSTPGQEICSPDGTQIGMCDQTNHVVLQPVAPGTVCSNGQMIAKPVAKRNFRFARDHVRRHQTGFLEGRNWQA